MRRTFQVILIPIESRTLCGSPKTVERCNRMEGRKDYREASEREYTRARLARDPRDGRFSSRPPPLPPRASEGASERPAAYKIQIVCPPLRCVPRSFSSVGLGRGRSFRRLSFKQKNHLFRWWVPFVFWNFLAGPTRDPRTDTGAAGDTKSEPVYLEGTEGKGSDRAGRRQGRKLLARSRCNRSGGRGRRTGKRRTARNCGIVVEAGNCGQMNAHAGDGGRAERGGRGMMMGRAGVDVDEGEAHGLGHQGRERRVVRLAPPSSPRFLDRLHLASTVLVSALAGSPVIIVDSVRERCDV